MFKFFLLIFLCFLLTNCSIQSGLLNSDVNLNSGNFEVIKVATGSSEVSYFLGFGGMKSKGLYSQAKENLYKNADLKSNQTIANITIDQKRTLILIYYKHEIILSGDVIEFKKPVDSDFKIKSIYNISEDERDSSYIDAGKKLIIGDKVEFQVGFSRKTGSIIEIDGDYYLIEFFDTKNSEIRKKWYFKEYVKKFIEE